MKIPIRNITTSCEDACRIRDKETFDEDLLRVMSKRFSAISNPTRLKIILLTLRYGEITTCELENALGLSQPKVSYHLQNLVGADIIQRRTYGPWSIYSLKDGSEIVKMLRKISTSN